MVRAEVRESLSMPLRVRALRALARRALCTGQTRGDTAINDPLKNNVRIHLIIFLFVHNEITNNLPTTSSSTRKENKKLKYKMTSTQGTLEGLQPSNPPPILPCERISSRPAHELLHSHAACSADCCPCSEPCHTAICMPSLCNLSLDMHA